MENKKPEENKMEIEINKYKNLVDALGDPVRVARMVLLIAAVTAIVAIGIIAIVCGIKRFYPYKSINSNPYGATIIQDEDNEIIYWLFNSADLWANSGIEVKEGDVISVRPSGAFHTAIHHLVEDANNNTKLRDPWSHSEGRGPLPESPLYERSKARAKYRIAPDLSRNTILMQVIPSKVGGKDGEFDWRTETNNTCYVDGQDYTSYKVTDHCKSGLKTEKEKPDIYKIGLGKENIRIRTDGVLHFAVNDIALTPRVIKQMKESSSKYQEILEISTVNSVWYAKTNNQFDELFTSKGLNLIKPTYHIRESDKIDTLKREGSCSRSFECLTNCKRVDNRRDTISSEEWNLQHLKLIGLVDEHGLPIEKYWNEGKIKDSTIINICNHLNDANCEYSNELILSEIPYLKRMGLLDTDIIPFNNLLMIKECGLEADSIQNDKYLIRIGFNNNVRFFYNTEKNTYLIDSISSKESIITRHTINKEELDCIYSSLYLAKLGLLDSIWHPIELDYYKDTKFVDAWFVDNIGSFMIVIERKKAR